MPTTLDCGLEPCPEHGALCAYHGDEPDRCPTCHASWSVILDRIARDKGDHSCEFKGGRHTHRPDMPAAALKRRQDAAEKPYKGRQSLHCPHRVAELGRDRYGPQIATQGVPEGMVPA